jgi:hypothetical protein
MRHVGWTASGNECGPHLRITGAMFKSRTQQPDGQATERERDVTYVKAFPHVK